MPLETVYARTALLMLPPALLLIPLTRRLRACAAHSPDVHTALPADCLRQSLRRPRVLLLLAANGLVFSVFSLMFFFLTTFTAQSGVGDPGLFFTVSTAMMIGIRLLLGHLFDRYDKATLAMASLAALAVGLLLLGAATSATGFYAAAAVYGAGGGAATPLMNSLMFAISPPLFRGLNTNLMLEMVDAGFFIGPAGCGLALSSGLGRTPVLAACVECVLLAAPLHLPLRHASPEEP
jgi:MFS family permease